MKSSAVPQRPPAVKGYVKAKAKSSFNMIDRAPHHSSLQLAPHGLADDRYRKQRSKVVLFRRGSLGDKGLMTSVKSPHAESQQSDARKERSLESILAKKGIVPQWVRQLVSKSRVSGFGSRSGQQLPFSSPPPVPLPPLHSKLFFFFFQTVDGLVRCINPTGYMPVNVE